MKHTKPAPTLPHTRNSSTLNKRIHSASLLRRRSPSILIETHPSRPTTKLRRVPIAGHSTMIRTSCRNSRRFDTLPIAIATAVTSAQKSAVSKIMQIRRFGYSYSLRLTRSRIPHPCTRTRSSKRRSARRKARCRPSLGNSEFGTWTSPQSSLGI